MLLYVGQGGGVEEDLAERAGIPFSAIETGQIRGRTPWEAARNLARMQRGAAQAAARIRDFRPDVVLLTGGYVSAPVAWAAWRAGLPVLIYLPDLEPGLEIRVTSRFATKVAVSFPEAAGFFPGKAVITGYPVRPELWEATRSSARAALGLPDDRPVLLVFGGSHGARSINQALTAALPELLPRCDVVHISGTLDWPSVQEWAQGTNLAPALQKRYHAYPYLHDAMTDALRAADLVVARAGASTLGEFPALGLPSILIPYPYAGQHQENNARYLAERGAARILPDAELAAQLVPTVLGLLDDPAKLAEMGRAAAVLARPDAAANIAGLLVTLAGTGPHAPRAD